MGNIKAVIVYSMMNPFNKNRRIHYGMLEKFKDLCKECHIYTVKVDIKKPNKAAMDAIYKRHKPDVFILYDGRIQTRKNSIGLGVLKDIPCKKISICIDLPEKKDRDDNRFFTENGIDLVFQRGTYINEKLDIPSVWLPFSADKEEFKVDHKIIKIKNKVGIAATYKPKVYSQRQEIIRLLNKNKLLKICERECRQSPQAYINFLNSLNVGVTSVETKLEGLTTPRAKMFEYMASKTAVLTPTFIGIDNLLTKSYNNYVEIFDMNNLVDKTKKLLNDDKRINQMIKNSYDLFLKYHTDRKRAKEMYENVLNLLEERGIVKKWGR